MVLNPPLGRRLRMGLIGGGQGSFIGRVHAIAATLDLRAELVAGALSSDPERAKASAAGYGISADRAYGSYRELIERELALPANQRIDFVAIATPNHTHFEIAKAAVDAGFHVICRLHRHGPVPRGRSPEGLGDRGAPERIRSSRTP